MIILNDNVFTISYESLNDNVIDLLIVKLKEYQGENVLDYRTFTKDKRKYIIGFERKYTKKELQKLKDNRKQQEKIFILNLFASLGGRMTH